MPEIQRDHVGRGHRYVVTVSAPNMSSAWKAAKHLSFSMHWDRSFSSVSSDAETVNAHEHTIRAYGEWANMENDLTNFARYYPHTTFTVTVDGVQERIFN